MPLKSLDQLRKLRAFVNGARRRWLALRHGIVFEGDVTVSLSSRLQPTGRGSIVVGHQTLIAFKTLVYTWDELAGAERPVRIGSWCFIGGGSVITPGVTIGDGSIIGAGSVVFDDVPPACIAAGNPAKVVRTGIEVTPYGRLKVASTAAQASS
jgi:maltose O-acetyltransferase